MSWLRGWSGSHVGGGVDLQEHELAMLLHRIWADVQFRCFVAIMSDNDGDPSSPSHTISATTSGIWVL